jgi:hypothetical protein
MIDYTEIFKQHYPNAEWSIEDNNYDTLVWLSSGEKPSKETLDSLWETTLKNIQANEYKIKRAKEYPSFAEQFDLLYHGGYDAWKAAISSIKEKYPKTV